jgi:CubicO group peptidase (beta-lactamase class C family)
MKTKQLLNLFFVLPFVLISFNNIKGEKNRFKELEKQIDSLRVKYNVPAIAYGVVRNDSVIVKGVIGYRDIETNEKAQTDDLFHIGSNTKSFTSFLAGKLVEDGLISWNTNFFDLYPEMKAESDSAYYNITLLQLLSHRAKLINFKNESEVYPIVDYEKNLGENLNLAQKRYYFIKQALKYNPIPWYDHPDDRYSNAGYIAAAMMLEKVTGKTWEQLIIEQSEKLGLEVYIGWPDDNKTNQPKGHINPKKWMIDIEKDLIPIPDVLKKYHYFNQYVLLCSPSGNLSITLKGFLKFLELNIDGLNGKDNYLKSKTYKELFTSYPDYSCGWMHENYYVPCFHHKGSAGTFNSVAIIVPEKNLGIVVMVNTYDGTVINEIAKLLINKFAM